LVLELGSISGKRKEKRRKTNQTFIGFCRKRLNMGKFDQINLELAQI
jgi:hypothetical protein